MIFTYGSSHDQLFPMKYRNFNDGVPFNWTSYRIFGGGPSFRRVGRVYPAGEHNLNRNMFNAFMSFRNPNGSYSDIPVVEYNNNTWDEWGTTQINNRTTPYFAPGMMPQYTATDEVNCPYIFDSYKRNAAGSFKTASNRRFWTTTFDPLESTQNCWTYSFSISTILIVSNATTIPTIMPATWNILALPTSTTDIENDFWLQSPVNLDIAANEVKVITSGTGVVGNTIRNYKILAVKALLHRGTDYLQIYPSYHQIAEMSIPFISFKNQSNGDEVGFLEIEWNMSEPSAPSR